MDKEYKKVRKMYLVCEHCGESNEKVSMRNTYEMILCNNCYNKIIRGHYEVKDNKINIVGDNDVKDEPSYNVPNYNDEGKIMCNECGCFFDCLGNHLRHTHHMTTSEYRKKYKYNKKVKLTSKDYSNFCRERMANIDMEKQVKRIFYLKRKKQQELIDQVSMDDYKL